MNGSAESSRPPRPIILSCAQNFEDVILFRALYDKPGTYIDVGAQHPVRDSVTYAFYKEGWHGINIEPSAQYFKKLKKTRSRDTNLQIVVSDYTGEADFYQVRNSGLSTIIPDFARQAAELGFNKMKQRMPCMTLDKICRDHNAKDVRFLKIDVEGAELQVLRGFSFQNVRPIVVVVEATKPLSMEPNHLEWESYVVRRGYKMVYADGLNRFYLAREHSKLEQHFQHPPNPFDSFRRHVDFGDVAFQWAQQYPKTLGWAHRQMHRSTFLRHTLNLK